MGDISEYYGFHDMMDDARRERPPVTMWIIWNPEAPMPPSRVFVSERYADEIAQELRKQHVGQRFDVVPVIEVR